MESIPLLDTKQLRDISSLAQWSVSSQKPGMPISHVLDANPDTYWQSDGPQPHSILLAFPKRHRVSHIGFYIEFKNDESYTPRQIQIRAGDSRECLIPVKEIEWDEPSGWVVYELGQRNSMGHHHDEDFQNGVYNGGIDLFFLEIQVLTNHQNGKDSHLRCVKVFSPSTEHQRVMNTATVVPSSSSHHYSEGLPFSSVEFQMYSTIR